jgi:hypothetical protein
MAHEHRVYDTDAHFTINTVTREIPKISKRIVQYDHNSERFTFEMSRFVDDHDMSQCSKVEIHYLNVSGGRSELKHEDVYIVDDVQVSPDSDNVVIFSWLISSNATQYAGTLNFLIKFTCLTGTTVDYVWNTGIFSGVTVAEGMNNGEAVVEEYSDILAEWEQRMFATTLPEFTEEDEGKMLIIKGGKAVWVHANKAKIGEVSLLGNGWVGTASPYSQVVAIEGVTEHSQVDLTPSVEQLAIFHQKDLAFVTENEDGVVTVYAIGQKPELDYTIQVTITEVEV